MYFFSILFPHFLQRGGALFEQKYIQPPFLCSNYDYAVINGDLNQAAAEMIALFRSFRLRTALLEQSDLLD